MISTERDVPAMQALFDDLRASNMEAVWDTGGHVPPKQEPDEPTVPYGPCRWQWSLIRSYMERAARLVEPGPDVHRRVVKLIHPALSGPCSTQASRFASHTVSGNVQMILPGERAPLHRHRNNAIRFIVEGNSAHSIVNGEAVEMNRGDLVLTPSFHWHGHVNESDGPVLWMDSLDGPIINYLRQRYMMEKWPAGEEPVTRPSQESSRRYGTRFLQPPGSHGASQISPLLIFTWAETRAALEQRAGLDGDPFDDIIFNYCNPSTGGHVTPTLGCQIQMIRAGVHTRAHRHSWTNVFHVVEGSGSTIVDGVRLDWEQGDFFTLPPHCWHEHVNPASADAVLFSSTDAPIIEALGLAREQPYTKNDEHQEISAVYDAA